MTNQIYYKIRMRIIKDPNTSQWSRYSNSNS